MKKLLSIVCILFMVQMIVAQENSILVFELFTSQGCSSCPPADEALDRIHKMHEGQSVFVLSYHVDYWNRLGWKDPFSSKTYTTYQQEYAAQFKSRSIYTPQVVVNGSYHFVGSNGTQLQNALHTYTEKEATNTIMITNVDQQKDKISFQYDSTGKAFHHTVFALVVAERITKVARGENSNRTLKNTNIVAQYIKKNETKGSVTLSIPDWITDTDQLSIIGYTKEATMKIIGATQYKLTKG